MHECVAPVVAARHGEGPALLVQLRVQVGEVRRERERPHVEYGATAHGRRRAGWASGADAAVRLGLASR